MKYATTFNGKTYYCQVSPELRHLALHFLANLYEGLPVEIALIVESKIDNRDKVKKVVPPNWRDVEIVQMNLDDSFVREWPSIKSIIEENETWSKGNICRACRYGHGQVYSQPTAYGFKWKYKKEGHVSVKHKKKKKPEWNGARRFNDHKSPTKRFSGFK